MYLLNFFTLRLRKLSAFGNGFKLSDMENEFSLKLSVHSVTTKPTPSVTAAMLDGSLNIERYLEARDVKSIKDFNWIPI